MKIQNQVCTLTQAEKLKQLNVLQGKSHIYIYYGDTGTNCDHYIVRERTQDGVQDLCADAFTVSELSIMLPCYAWAIPIYQGEINPNSDVCQEVKISLYLYHPECRIESLGNPEMVWKFICSSTLASAMADMLIFLLESGLVSINDVNERLSKQ